MSEDGGRAKRLIGRIYSAAADTLYEPLVVNGAFRVFGGNLNALVVEQGRRAVAQAHGGAILDLPVGTGYFAIEMARRHNGIVVGVDIAEGMTRKALSVARSARVDNLVAMQADAHRLPFPDGAFAAVVCSNGLQVMPGLVPSVRELVRVLAHGGRLYVSVLVAPIGAGLPRGTREHLPTFMRPGRDVADAIRATGVCDVTTRRERLAYLIEATKS
ncbi:MAG: class I SAM-dependent methyltransferase [Actinomycetota bacterium]